MIRSLLAVASMLVTAIAAGAAAPCLAAGEPLIGPFNMVYAEGSVGTERALTAEQRRLLARDGMTMRGWVRLARIQDGQAVLATLCAHADGNGCPTLVLDGGHVLFAAAQLRSARALATGIWHSVAMVCAGGRASLFVDGDATVVPHEVTCPAAGGQIRLAPLPGAQGGVHFGGSVAGLEVLAGGRSDDEMRHWNAGPPAFSLVHFTEVGRGWPLQETAWRGLLVPQDAWTLPHAAAAPDRPVATPGFAGAALRPLPDARWSLDRWRLAEGPMLHTDAATLSSAGYDDSAWWAATVPGTVLTTLIDRGVYPDPDHGLNNLAIPDSLARQDYWYRTSFTAPGAWRGRHLRLEIKGINYAAEIWLNGALIGRITGAFLRGDFDITDRLHTSPVGGLAPGASPEPANVLAVHILPPPHPGIPHEESLLAGPGGNGGSLALDGPTFIATEGWDWIPGIRDRDMGVWQGVDIRATGDIRLLDPRIVTRLDLPRTDSAAISLEVPVFNTGTQPVDADVRAAFGDVQVGRIVRVPPGETRVRFDPQTDPALQVPHPRLWWPNGYGAAALYELSVSVSIDGHVSDTNRTRFGMREITYELSLFDHEGRLRRVEVDPALASARGEQVVDVSHEAIRQTPNGWAASLTLAGETSPAVHAVSRAYGAAPFLTIHVNGVPIAARGGSWGMDDSRKRVSRARLEPFFKLHQQANINIIRNWLGQDTEDVFYDLADEYGMLVLNDFWESTQDFQLEAEDPQLFLANARDVIMRYRNHPCIAIWFGRNEGVPQPILDRGLDELVRRLDGTRYYNGSSNRVNLADSGPYNYREPEAYFTTLAKGFAVEVGTPSLSTLESLQATIPEPDRWPISDTLAYHDWHQDGNGDVTTFMAALDRAFGAATSLADFERKAQMLNYTSYRAIFEGFWAHLWTENSGRLLWMSHPAWPSNHWQMYSADMDAQASYYGVKKALEPVHAQLDLPDFAMRVVNTTLTDAQGLSLHSEVMTLAGGSLLVRDDALDAPHNATTPVPKLPLRELLARYKVVVVALTLRRADGTIASRNTYWQADKAGDLRALNAMPRRAPSLAAERQHVGSVDRVTATLINTDRSPMLQTKLTLLDMSGQRVLPVYLDDNYISLLPHETRTVTITLPAGTGKGLRLAVRGWNVVPGRVDVIEKN